MTVEGLRFWLLGFGFSGKQLKRKGRWESRRGEGGQKAYVLGSSCRLQGSRFIERIARQGFQSLCFTVRFLNLELGAKEGEGPALRACKLLQKLVADSGNKFRAFRAELPSFSYGLSGKRGKPAVRRLT